AYQTYEAARVLSDNSFWNSAVNRLYYSIFFAANALLVLNGIELFISLEKYTSISVQKYTIFRYHVNNLFWF
ncbi:MAG: HEPN domain-containing protein, partial [Bacteroidales bacterium]|nr:HEPN domain-containing protein [Bacteroidales bacterium]